MNGLAIRNAAEYQVKLILRIDLEYRLTDNLGDRLGWDLYQELLVLRHETNHYSDLHPAVPPFHDVMKGRY